MQILALSTGRKKATRGTVLPLIAAKVEPDRPFFPSFSSLASLSGLNLPKTHPHGSHRGMSVPSKHFPIEPEQEIEFCIDAGVLNWERAQPSLWNLGTNPLTPDREADERRAISSRYSHHRYVGRSP
jgi:hypothetical protein